MGGFFNGVVDVLAGVNEQFTIGLAKEGFRQVTGVDLDAKNEKKEKEERQEQIINITIECPLELDECIRCTECGREFEDWEDLEDKEY